LPCIAWGQVAVFTGSLDVGSPLALEGRVQSRLYTKVIDGEATERTAFEVSIMQLLPENDTQASLETFTVSSL
ncbi:MAG: single-stranded DNA-binding protein, partial [Oscillospiraceae bacterium]|nr:single-stranded DNA-binding protein [Oscillospiraceae bacterium]